MDDLIIVVPYDPSWPHLFAQIGQQLRTALNQQAVRIDHIGSTAIPQLAAKPVIDIQISVLALEPVTAYRSAIEAVGFIWRANNPDLTKRYFREALGQRGTHIHVRRAGSWSEQFALLFRDYLRTHPDDAEHYATLKQHLAQQYRHERDTYVAAKGPFIWTVMQRASQWSQDTGWEPGLADC
ncbi:MAG: GrpB family protein [Chloroflexota bacterium]|nr:GrpB family protein [Chloroflexota bacterium]